MTSSNIKYYFPFKHDEWAIRQQPLMKFIKLNTTPPLYYKPKIWTSKTEELQQESQRKLKGIHVTVCALYDVSYNLPNLLEMLETRRKELEEELVRVEEKANARLERVRERGSQVVPANEQDAELEELEAEIEMYALALGEEKEEDMELNPEEASQGPLTFPKHDPDETMDSA